MSALEEKLRQAKLKITPQRLEILRALHKVPPHPSVEQIYCAVKKRYPAVSLATVYKTLETLVEIGEIRVALISNGKTLYDTRLEDHHHFICTQCGYVEDVDIKLDCLETCAPSQLFHKHRVDHNEVVFHGVCGDCLSSESASPKTPLLIN